jgi:predicted dehydrogenase
MSLFRFAVIGIDHDHINGQLAALMGAGCEYVGFYSTEDDLAADFLAKYPMGKRFADKREILEDASIRLIVSAGVPGDRAATGLEAMRHGKDYLSDKPGLISLDELAEVRKVQAETGRIYSILYSEHYDQPATIKAGELIKAGAIGEVINTIGIGPHRLRKTQRPGWFFERARYGGILTDIGSHQAEQFLYFAGTDEARVVSATVRNLANTDKPGLQDFGEMVFATDRCTGYVRVDWFTPDGLPTWGDGRLTVLGTEGYIELRKYVDINGRPGTDHLFLVDRQGMQHIDCANVVKPFGRELAYDILNRTETHMTQAHCFKAMELALTAQALAEAQIAATGA